MAIRDINSRGGSLLPLRELCEKYLREELFQNVQDREQLQCVVDICRNREFWKWLSAVHKHVLLPLEELRRWGMCCPHKKCLEKRHDGQKHVLCDRNSRRLPQAWAEVEKLIANYKTWSKNLTPRDCEESRAMFRSVGTMQKMCAALLRKRFRYLSIVPWNLVLVDTPEGALEILRQWRARPPEDHDHLTRRFMEAHEADVVVVSEGGEPSDPPSNVGP